MTIIDYSKILNIVQRELGKRYNIMQEILNIPGKSIGCKLDNNYYLVLYPSFFEYLCKACGILPHTLIETLLKTGNMVKGVNDGDFFRVVEVKWEKEMLPIRVKAGFVLSSFIDNSLRFYGGNFKGPMPICSLKISKKDKKELEILFKNKTPLHPSVFFE